VAEWTTVERLRLFDEATPRQRMREKARHPSPAADREWTREDLYERGGTSDSSILRKPTAEP
jgi:hypothetical protein